LSDIYVETLEIAGFASTLKAMRLPMKSEEKSDSEIINGFCEPYNDVKNIINYEHKCVIIGEKDLRLLQKLIRSGDEHAKCVRGIQVWAEFNVPRYIWAELDTYVVGTVPLGSESTMHVEAKGLKDEELVEFKDNLKEKHIQKRIRVFSYQALRRIYFQRRYHRLPIWRDVIIPWIESLPLASELITINPWWQDKINELEAKLNEKETN
jgi:hypothetical protein